MKRKYLLIIVFSILLIISAFIVIPKEDKIIIVTGTQTPPFEYYNESGQLVGIDIDFIQAILPKLGLKYEIRLMDWDDALQLMKDKKADILLEAGYTKSREEFISYREEQKIFNDSNTIPKDVLWISGEVLMEKKDKDVNLSLSNIEKDQNRLGIVSGYHYFDKLWEKNINFYSYPNTKQLITGLINDEMDVVLIDKFEATSLMKSLGIDSNKFKYSNPLQMSGNFILFSKKYDNKKYRKIKENFYKELIKLKEEGFHEESYLRHTGKNFSETYKEFLE